MCATIKAMTALREFQERRSTMKKLALAVLAAGGALLSSPHPFSAQEYPGNPSFKGTEPSAIKNLASLAGCWVGKNPWGVPARFTYDLASDATVLIEFIEQQGQVPMYSALYIDGETPMIHHFCSYGSQIRLRLEPSEDPNVLLFKFVDATNLKSRHDDHMTSVQFTFRDKDHVDLEWGLHQNHKDLKERFSLTRTVEGCDVRRTVVWH
jgi:hypothetical protein